MPSHRDSAGRPIVVVTGMGVVTSLGAGKADNWKKLTAGQSGIRNITRFPTDGLKTRFAGTVDFVPADPLSAPELSERLAGSPQKKRSRNPASAARAISRGPCSSPCRRSRSNGRSGARWRRPPAPTTMSPTPTSCATAASGQYGHHHRALPVRLGRRQPRRPVRHQGLADLAVDRLRLRRDRDPARRRGDPPRRSRAPRCASAPTARSTTESLIRFSLLSALSTSNDPPEQAAKPFAKNRDGFVMAEGAGALVLESLEAALARGAKILGVIEGCGEMADAFHRTRSSPDGKPIIGCIRNALADAGLTPDDIDYINPHGTGTPENDKMECHGRHGRVRRARQDPFRSRPTSR